jgi:SpoVK/Ycf46/Vps4 family AAA+-type ATPase
MATTNHFHSIDKALTRPGRFDICLHFDNADEDIIEEIINHFSSKHKSKDFSSKHKSKDLSSRKSNNSTKKLSDTQRDEIKKYAKYNNRYIWSPAKITQLCLIHINEDDYYKLIIKSLQDEFEEQCKLL